MIAPFWSLVALALVPLIANWPLVSGWLIGDPVYTLSRLGMFLVPGPLAGVTSIDPSAGLMTEALGRAAAFQWLHGHIPWWNPFNGVGLPLAAEGQNQALFLPFVLLFALRNGPLLVLLVIQEVAGFATYALLRQLALTRFAAWIGAALFALNGTFAWFGHSPIMPVAFAPLLLLGIEMEWKAITEQRASRGWIVVAIALVLSLYAGFPETAYLDGLLCAAWTLLRLAQCRGAARARFTWRVGMGGLAGLLLATPYIVPFLHLLSVGQVNLPRMLDFSAVAIPLPALPVLLMPYLLGPQSLVLDWNRIEGALWSYLGGYLTPSIVLLAIVAVIAARAPGRALRWLLAGWCVVMIGASFGVPWVAHAVYAFPALKETMVFRYSPPSWELAAIILAAMAIDDWQHARIRRRGLAASLVITLAAAVAALAAAWHSIVYLWANVAHYAPWIFASAGGAAAVLLGAVVLLAARPAPLRSALLGALIVGESIALFSVPRLAGLRHAELDTGAVDYLQQHLGLQRAFAFGTLLPNYSAWFQVAAIDSNYVPAPHLWTEYIRTALDPGSQSEFFDGITVFGAAPRTDMVAFRAYLPAYAELGVRYVLVPVYSTLAQTARIEIATPAEPASLQPGESLDVTLPGSLLAAGAVASVSVIAHRADGALALTVCAGDVCRSGLSELASAVDNAPLSIALDAPLPVGAGREVHLRITHEDGTAAAEIPRFAQPGGAGVMPGLALTYAIPGLAPRPVFVSQSLSVYELQHPAPYFETTGAACRVTPLTREAATTDCDAPARLIRRELFYDGWRATVNGRTVAITKADPIFQAIDLPAGTARIQFRYAPPYAGAITAAFVAGLLVIAVGMIGWPRFRASANAARLPVSR